MLPTEHESQYFDFCNPSNVKRTIFAGILPAHLPDLPDLADLPDLPEMGHGWQVRTPLPHAQGVRMT